MKRESRIIEPTRLIQLLASYGANPKRWPKEERKAAQQLLKTSTPLQNQQQQALKLDRLLDAVSAPKPALELRARILARLPVPPTLEAGEWIAQWLGNWQFSNWRMATLFLVPLCLGIVLGLSVAGYSQYNLEIQDELADLSVQDEVTLLAFIINLESLP